MDTFCRSFDEAPHTAGALNSHETPDTGDAGHTAGTAPRTWVGSWLCTWHTGPDAGGTHRLGVGRHLVGRAHTATVRCDDPALQPHHALLEVRADGALTLTQLTGRAPVLVDGAPLTGSTTALASVRLAVGNSTITCSRADDDGSVAPAAQVVHGALIRSPRALPTYEPPDLAPPAPPDADHHSAGSVAPALIGLAGAGAIAMVMQQPMFLLFGTLGATVAVGSWGAQRLAARRRHRRALHAHALARRAYLTAALRNRDRFRAFHVATVPTVAAAQQAIGDRSAQLWSRRATHSDAFTAGLGLGNVPWPAAAALDDADGEPEALDLPLPADLGPGCRLAVRGPNAHAVARSLLVQLAASCGPADLRCVIVTDRPAAWDCVRGLPNLTLPGGSAAVVAECDLGAALAELGDHAAHLLFLTDQASALAARTSPLRRALADAQAHALLVVLAADGGVPHLCTSVLSLTSGPVGRWVADTHTTLLPVPVRVAGIGERSTFACTAALRSLIDPEDPLSVATGVPHDLSLTTLLSSDGDASLTPAGIVAGWLAVGDDPNPRTLIGVAADGAVDIDLVRDGPHGLIAGTTGAGKSELLRSLVVGMAAGASPAHLSFALVDYKGGATFDACAALPHVVGVITDLDDQLAERALRSLHAELRRREGILREHGATDLATLRARAPQVLLPRLVVVIDEFAALVAEQPTFLHALVDVAQRGRSLGVHLLLATQRPSGVINDNIRANTNLRLALRLQDTADAIDVVGAPTPALLPRGVPGRAVMRLGADDHLTFQTAHCTATKTTGGESELQVLVRAICEAALLAGTPLPPAPWAPVLPPVLARSDVPAGAVGLLDDPDRQRVAPLQWAPGDGHLLIAGSPGAGVTSTIHTLATHALTHDDPSTTALHVYVLDGRGDQRLTELTARTGCVAVVRLHERERLMRLLHRLRGLTRAGMAQRSEIRVVLFIDGLDAVRRALDEVATATEFDALEEVLANGEAAGITIVAGVEHAAAVPAGLLARCAHRWVMHLHDAHDATVLGLAAARVPAASVAGRLVVAASGLAAQVMQPGASSTTAGDGSPATTPAVAGICIVPAMVDPGALAAGGRSADATELPLGIDFASGEAHALHLPDGEHLLVLGGPRSGRSNTLARLSECWLQAHPDGWFGAILPRRSSSVTATHTAPDTSILDDVLHDALPSCRPVLLVVDDAEFVDDPGGRLAALAAGCRPDTWIFAGGRPDALRQLYGHWTTVVRRSRTGVVHTGGSDLDGDLLGVVLPRRTPIPARPGLAWLVAGGSVHLTQVALQVHPRQDRPLTPVP